MNMNNLKNYFSSPEKSGPIVLSAQTQKVTQDVVTQITISPENPKICNPITSSITTLTYPYIVKTPRPDSKLILQNMEEVLNSVKRKHKQKHRRKREQKKRAKMKANAEADVVAAPSTGTTDSKVMEENEKTDNERGNCNSKSTIGSKKNPLQESTDQGTSQHRKSESTLPTKRKLTLGREKSIVFNISANEQRETTLLNNFKQTPKNDKSEISSQVSPPKQFKSNAFELMMNARNKSLELNPSGKEAIANEEIKVTSAVNAKRKKFLQEWAEKKGANKRKLEDDARQSYVEKHLKRRAKKLKAMLLNGSVTNNDSLLSMPETPPTKKKIKQRKSQESVKKGKQIRRSRQEIISPVEIIDKQNTPSQHSPTDSFLSKLSSPTKKRDSLLGYFPKKDNKTESSTLNAEVNTTPIEISLRKKRGKKKKSIAEVVHTPPPQALNEIVDVDSTCARPKRLCSGKIRYDFDLQESPTKDEIQPLASKNTGTIKCSNITFSTLKTTASQSAEVINLDDSEDSINISMSKPKETPKKLAPLFMRPVPKPSLSPDVLNARKQFLMSGVPDKIRQEMAKQRQYEQVNEKLIEFFPSISHVMQLSEGEKSLLNSEFSVSFRLHQCSPSSPHMLRKSKSRVHRLSISNITECRLKDFRSKLNNSRLVNKSIHDSAEKSSSLLLPPVENKRRIIKIWKNEFERFPTFKCYNQMREKYRFFSAMDSAQDTEQVTESLVVTRKTRRSLETKKFDPNAEEEKPPLSAPNGELLFTEKYKPMLSEQVLVNLTPVNQLREFLSSWNTSNGGSNNQHTTNTPEDSMQSLEFINDSSSGCSVASTSVVLLGPGSSGKTNAVFALANEMNFNVLEINAGMKRSGKKLLQELQEATQSHQIRKETNSTIPKNRNSNHLIKFSTNDNLKKKNQKSSISVAPHVDENSSSNGVELSQSVRKSLILIEDADIIFDQHDAGFVDAVYTLSATSKRPVIIVASRKNCQHLQRLFNQNKIEFAPANELNISRYLSVLSLIENCPIHQDDLLSLYLFNRRDLRKTILETQFYIQSGGDRNGPLPLSKYRLFSGASSNNISIKSYQKYDDVSSQHNSKLEDEEIPKHQGLFNFYTISQNSSYRIPFPVDFSLLRENINDILHKSKNLQEEQSTGGAACRKSRSPKKVWLSAISHSPMQTLSTFFENISIATLIGVSNKSSNTFPDRLIPNFSEEISHSIVERAIDVNLASGNTLYNFFSTPKECFSLSVQQPSSILRTSASISLDYEPVLRTICRSEKIRSASERRSSRFYHYLRNCSVNHSNFSTEYFDRCCPVLWD